MKKKTAFKTVVFAVMLALLLPTVFASTDIISAVGALLTPTTEAVIEIDGAYIKNVPLNSTVEDVTSSFTETGSFVTNGNGIALSPHSKVGTGYKLVNGTESYTIIVDHDLNGDTYCTTKDVIRAKKYLASGDAGVYLSALDMDGNGKFDKTDIPLLSEFVLENKPVYDLADMIPADLGTGFYATIDLSYNENVVTANLDGNVVSYSSNKSANQIWYFTRNEDDGSYLIENLGLGKAMDVAYASGASGQNVSLYNAHNEDNQRWFLIETDRGYIFRPKCAFDKVLDVQGGLSAIDTNLRTYDVNYTAAQAFGITKLDAPDKNSLAYFDSVGSLNYQKTFYANIVFGATSLAVGDSNNLCVETNSKGSADQIWKFTYQTDGSYIITSLYNDKVIDISGGTIADTTNLQVYANNGTTAQRWYIELKDGKAIFRSLKDQSYVIDVSSGKDQNGWNVQLYSMNASAAQWFTISNFTTTAPAYRVADPYNSTLYGTYSSFNEAKALADSYAYLGYTVFNANGSYAYSTGGTHMSAKIVHHAKIVSDFAAAQGFTYNNAATHPGYNWEDFNNPKTNEKVSSCDRLVDWVLWRCGYTNQSTANGLFVYQLMSWLEGNGFTKVTDSASLKPGDIVFTTFDPTRPGNPPGHVFICASNNRGGNSYLRYDHGSTARIRYQQGTEYLNGKAPFLENIGTADQPLFYYAYRAPASA